MYVYREDTPFPASPPPLRSQAFISSLLLINLPPNVHTTLVPRQRKQKIIRNHAKIAAATVVYAHPQHPCLANLTLKKKRRNAQSATRQTLTTVAPAGGSTPQGLRAEAAAAAAARGRGRGSGRGRGAGVANTLSAAVAKTVGGVLGATVAIATPAEVAAAAAVDTARVFASKLNQVCIAGRAYNPAAKSAVGTRRLFGSLAPLLR